MAGYVKERNVDRILIDGGVAINIMPNRNESTQTQEGVNCVVKFSQFSEKQVQALFGQTVCDTSRNENSAERSREESKHGISMWKHL